MQTKTLKFNDTLNLNTIIFKTLNVFKEIQHENHSAGSKDKYYKISLLLLKVISYLTL